MRGDVLLNRFSHQGAKFSKITGSLYEIGGRYPALRGCQNTKQTSIPAPAEKVPVHVFHQKTFSFIISKNFQFTCGVQFSHVNLFHDIKIRFLSKRSESMRNYFIIHLTSCAYKKLVARQCLIAIYIIHSSQFTHLNHYLQK